MASAPDTDAATAGDAPAAHADGTSTPLVDVLKIALILTVITAVEVSAYYTPAWENSWIYVPSMIFLSTIKFVLVVMFYMHLKYDHKVFRALFTGPFVVASLTLVGLLFLFSKLSLRLGILG